MSHNFDIGTASPAALSACPIVDVLVPGDWYTWVHNAGGVLGTVTLYGVALSTSELSLGVHVVDGTNVYNGLYDWENCALLRLEDDLGNVIEGASNITNFPWNDVNYSGNKIDASSAFLEPASGLTFTDNTLQNGSFVDLSGYTGVSLVFDDNFLSGGTVTEADAVAAVISDNIFENGSLTIPNTNLGPFHFSGNHVSSAAAVTINRPAAASGNLLQVLNNILSDNAAVTLGGTKNATYSFNKVASGGIITDAHLGDNGQAGNLLVTYNTIESLGKLDLDSTYIQKALTIQRNRITASGRIHVTGNFAHSATYTAEDNEVGSASTLTLNESGGTGATVSKNTVDNGSTLTAQTAGADLINNNLVSSLSTVTLNVDALLTFTSNKIGNAGSINFAGTGAITFDKNEVDASSFTVGSTNIAVITASRNRFLANSTLTSTTLVSTPTHTINDNVLINSQWSTLRSRKNSTLTGNLFVDSSLTFGTAMTNSAGTIQLLNLVVLGGSSLLYNNGTYTADIIIRDSVIEGGSAVTFTPTFSSTVSYTVRRLRAAGGSQIQLNGSVADATFDFFNIEAINASILNLVTGSGKALNNIALEGGTLVVGGFAAVRSRLNDATSTLIADVADATKTGYTNALP